MWCPGRDLNPDELPHTPLKRTRIPIPPPGQVSPAMGSEGMVPREGLEPTRPCGHWYLKPARLPIPPPRHGPRTTVTGRRRGAMLAHPKIDPTGPMTCRTTGPSSVSRSHDDLVGEGQREQVAAVRQLLLERAVGGLALARRCPARGPCASSVVERRVLEPGDVRAAGQRLARGEQRIEVRVEADVDVDDRDLEVAGREPVGRRTRPAAARRASTARPSAVQSAATASAAAYSPGLAPIVGLSSSIASGFLASRRVPAVVLLGPAGGLERLGRGLPVERRRADRPPGRTAATPAGSARGRGRRGIAKALVDDRRPVDAPARSAVGPRRRRTPGGSGAG